MKTVRNILRVSGILCVVIAAGVSSTQAQEQGITITPDTPKEPHPNALFEVIEDDKGILIPRIDWSKIDGLNGDDIQVDNTTSREPAGLLVYVNSGTPPPPDGEGFYYYDPEKPGWRKIAYFEAPVVEDPWTIIEDLPDGQTLPDGSTKPYFEQYINTNQSGYFERISSTSEADLLPLAIRKFSNGNVQLRGYLKAGAYSTTSGGLGIFDVPIAYRPAPSQRTVGLAIRAGSEGWSSLAPVSSVTVDDNGQFRMHGQVEASMIYFLDIEYATQ